MKDRPVAFWRAPSSTIDLAVTVREIERFFSIRYVEELRFPTPQLLKRAKRWLPLALKMSNDEEELASFFAKEHPPFALSIRFIDETVGYGLFSLEEIPEKNLLMEYAGVYHPLYGWLPSHSRYSMRYPALWFIPSTYAIDATVEGNLSRFMNHSTKASCEPLVKMIDGVARIFLQTNRKILPQEPLTFDYGKDFWRNVPPPVDL